VNVHGSRAEVIVRERIPKPEVVPEDEPTNVVAEKSGILTELRVLRGETLVKTGQTVLAGDILVSGFVTSSFAPVRMEHAMAEIKARTWYELSACSPLTEEIKVPDGKDKSRYAVIFFGRRINFYAGSGILWPNCDKIKEEKKLALKDVFTLPVKLVKETCRPYRTVTVRRDENALLAELQDSLSERLAKEIGEDGSVVSTAFSSAKSGGVLIVTLRAECNERIDGLRPLDRTQLSETQAED
jgi:similar to stage IV sporulation protein